MCELKVFLDGDVVFRDVIYAKNDGNKIILKDVLGITKTLDDCQILEVNIGSESLILTKNKKSKDH